MAEAEDVISDAARHATIFAQRMWQRHRQTTAGAPFVQLTDLAERLDLLIGAVFGHHRPIRVAQLAARKTFLAKVFKHYELPVPLRPVPATDGSSLWLPADVGDADANRSLAQLRVMALQQAMRVHRGSAILLMSNTTVAPIRSVLERDLYLLLEASAADEALVGRLPGLADAIEESRRLALSRRPPLKSLSPWHRSVELMLRSVLESRCGQLPTTIPWCSTPSLSATMARTLAAQLQSVSPRPARWGDAAFVKDEWTGDFRLPPGVASGFKPVDPDDNAADDDSAVRSARLSRSPKVRAAKKDEDDEKQGAWMVQAAAPIEQAEDPMGMQRPTDRDDQTPAEEFADSLSELAEARLVTTPARPKDILLSSDPPEGHATTAPQQLNDAATKLAYPEWDFRARAYRDPGVTVHLVPAAQGSARWVEETLERHRNMLDVIRRRFEMLRPERVLLRKQADGENLDLDACIDALADRRAGKPTPIGLYETQRPGKRNMAIMILIDVSGSTDSWLTANQRVIDVEREALLLVCTALESLGQPYSVQAFSGEGPHGVTVSAVKRYDDHYGPEVAKRIAALEPERYTRAGAALRHATALLMKEAAEHRLLLLLSDGKPNDADNYEGRYGVEDMRQAVSEARLQGIFPFCLTIDRQAANYLPTVFGARQYALLPRSDLLPAVLLNWMRKLLAQ